MTSETITLWLEDGQDVDELIDAYLLEHPEHADREFFVIGWEEEEE